MSMWLPSRVTPPPLAVPRLMVTNSRMVLWLPISILVCSPPKLRSWGLHADGAKKERIDYESRSLLAPGWPRARSARSSRPGSTPAPITQNGPTEHVPECLQWYQITEVDESWWVGYWSKFVIGNRCGSGSGRELRADLARGHPGASKDRLS